jgi:UDP-N-acetylglucosamine 2-epimerase (non-hydrolysing)
MNRKKILFVFGTRPEAIKMAPVIHECYRHRKKLDTRICLTGQHKEMSAQVMDFFKLREDYDLELMKPDQTLFELTSRGLLAIRNVLHEFKPDIVLVQGDTTTALAGALASFYEKTKLAHIEAGLRSFDKYAPFPEEVNRRMISVITDLHFAPTRKAADNLRNEGLRKNIFLTGNTVIDALLWAVKKVRKDSTYASAFSFLDPAKKVILITGHRRESFGKPFEQICSAILELATRYPDTQFVYPVHLNPNVQKVVRKMLSKQENIFLIAPLDYPHLIWLMDRSYLILTDSGGIQEEAPTLGKPVLVMREVTEREEGIKAGTAVLVGTSKKKILAAAIKLLDNPKAYSKMSRAVNPYGKGDSALKITAILLKESK